MSNKVKIDVRGDAQVMDMLAKLPKLVVSAGGPTDRAIARASTIVAKRMRQVVPDSKRTKSRERQSKKTKAKWPAKLKTQIKVRKVKYATASWAQVGPKNPEGNVAYFMQEKARRLVLWGKMTRVEKYRITQNFHTRAYEETKSEQQSAMLASLRADIDNQMRSL